MAISQTRRARATRRRAGRMLRADNDLTAEQWLAILEAWGCCAYCGDVEKALQKDCVQPLSRGGRYTLDNVVPACGSCNASKSNDEVTSWLRRKKLDERAFLLRYSEISVLLRL
jgi:5-methylcytosine-specific restriction endonuclease McrA